MTHVKKTLVVAFCAVLTCVVLASCTNGPGQSSSSSTGASWSGTIDFAVDYGDSALYTHDDIDGAVRAVMEEFGTWKGTTMKSMSFTDDELCKDSLQYCNDLRRGNASRFDAAIVLKSDFRSPNEEDAAGTAWEPDKDYTDYMWYLGRTGDGDWQLVNWGY